LPGGAHQSQRRACARGVAQFSVSALVEGRRFCHVRWLMDDPAVATLMGLERVRGEDALPRLAKNWILKVCATG